MGNSLYLVASPFQLLNAIEYRLSHSNESSSFLVVLLSEKSKTLSQIKELSTWLDWTEVIYLKGESSKLKRLESLKQIKLFLKNRISGDFELIVGDFRSFLAMHLANRYTAGRVTVVDDGTATLRLYDHRFTETPTGGVAHKKRLPLSIRRILRKIIYRINTDPFGQIKLFSIYNVPVHEEDTLLPNTYSSLRQNKNYEYQQDLLVIIGSCISELGIITEEYERGMMDRLRKKFKDHKIRYLPHRKENVQKIHRYERLFHFEVVTPELPIEADMIKSGIIPGGFFSFFSSAIDSLHLLTEEFNTTFWIHEIPNDAIKQKESIAFVRSVYDYMKKNYSNSRLSFM